MFSIVFLLHFCFFSFGFNSYQYQTLPLPFPECRSMTEDDRVIKAEKNAEQEDKHHSCLCLVSSFFLLGRADSSFPLGMSWGLQTDTNTLITFRQFIASIDRISRCLGWCLVLHRHDFWSSYAQRHRISLNNINAIEKHVAGQEVAKRCGQLSTVSVTGNEPFLQHHIRCRQRQQREKKALHLGPLHLDPIGAGLVLASFIFFSSLFLSLSMPRGARD